MTLQSITTAWDGVGVAGQNVFQSTWFSSVAQEAHLQNGSDANSTGPRGVWSNLTDFGCEAVGADSGYDGDACQLQVLWNDIFGRENSTNITITIDNVVPEVNHPMWRRLGPTVFALPV